MNTILLFVTFFMKKKMGMSTVYRCTARKSTGYTGMIYGIFEKRLTNSNIQFKGFPNMSFFYCMHETTYHKECLCFAHLFKVLSYLSKHKKGKSCVQQYLWYGDLGSHCMLKI